MNLSAYTRNIDDILTLNRKYVVPRFQREYSWDEVEHETLWKDICDHIKISGSEFTLSDYFIGSLVLVGDDTKDKVFQIVDGQQRLTTITIIFSALSQRYRDIGETSLAQSCYSFVEGKDGDYKPFFKLENENPKPFMQKRIQFIDILNNNKNLSLKPSTEEEERLLKAYEFYYSRLSENNLKEKFGNQFDYVNMLKIIRDQIIKFKTIFITVNTMEEAYTIFETLNAKGKDLLTIDLIKNKIFKLLNGEHPDDDAKTYWSNLKKTLNSRNKRINISVFLRHYWISKYDFVTESKIYESFNRRIEESENEYNLFLTDLLDSAKSYCLISNPDIKDWLMMEEKEIYYSLSALNTFDVVQPRPLILALFDARKRKILNVNDVRETLKYIEKFHFLFSGITSSRASGLEGKYSTLSRKLRKCSNKTDARKVIEELKTYLNGRKPDIEIFRKYFADLEFVNDKTADKKLIQYIFFNIEKAMYSTDEIIPHNLTLEHIYPQSGQLENRGRIGNILPLSKEINSNVKDDNLEKKMPEFLKSELKAVKEFSDKHNSKTKWTNEDIDERTNELSDYSYSVVWNI